MRRRVRLTENDLHRIVRSSVKRILNEDISGGERATIIINGRQMHLIVGVDPNSLGDMGDDVWDISLEDFLVGAVDVNEDIWYVYSNGRCYETLEEV